MTFKPIKYRAHNGYDTEEASDATAIHPKGESLTVQSMAEDADINVLMHRYGITGKMPDNPKVPRYGDFSGITDYQTALNAIMDAQENFMELPANIRARFANDPQQLLEFVANPVNIEEGRKLGIFKEAPNASNGTPSTNAPGPTQAPASSAPGHPTTT